MSHIKNAAPVVCMLILLAVGESVIEWMLG